MNQVTDTTDIRNISNRSEIKFPTTFGKHEINTDKSSEPRIDETSILEWLPVDIYHRIVTFSDKEILLTLALVSKKIHTIYCEVLKNFFGISLYNYEPFIHKTKIEFVKKFTDITLKISQARLKEFCSLFLNDSNELALQFKQLQFKRLHLLLTIDSSTISDIKCVLDFLKNNQKAPLVTTLHACSTNSDNITPIKDLLDNLKPAMLEGKMQNIFKVTEFAIGNIYPENIEQINTVLNSIDKNQIKYLRINDLETALNIDFDNLDCLEFRRISPQADLKLKKNMKVKNLILGEVKPNIDKIKATVLDCIEPLEVKKLGFTRILGNIDLTPFKNLEYLELGEIGLFSTITINGFLKDLTTLQVQASNPKDVPAIKPLLEKIAQCLKISKLIFGTGGSVNVGNSNVDLESLSVFKDLKALTITAKEYVFNEYPFKLPMLEDLEWKKIDCKINLTEMAKLKRAKVEIVESGAHIIFPKNLEEVHLGSVKKGAYIDLSLCINLKKVTYTYMET